MGPGRLEAFSDGVIAIIITIMVLELKAPTGTSPAALLHLAPEFSSYAFSFLVVAIMWVNHHQILGMTRTVGGAVLWLNNNLLFWMSLIPFATAYLGKHWQEPLAVAVYGAVLGMAAAGFTLLRLGLARQHRGDRELETVHRRALRKAYLGSGLYLSAAPLAFVSIYASYFIFLLIPVIYFLPERHPAAAKAARGH